MAYVLQFAPQDFVQHPAARHDPVPPVAAAEVPRPVVDQLADHPRRHAHRAHDLPAQRRPGRRPGRPAEGDATIGPDDTLGDGLLRPALSRWASQAMLEAADLVVAGKHTRDACRTNRRRATKAGAATPRRASTGRNHVDFVYNLIRGCNPAPGAWTTLNGQKIQIFDARKHPYRRFADVAGKIGEVSDVTDASFRVSAQGGAIEVLRARGADGKKVPGATSRARTGWRPGRCWAVSGPKKAVEHACDRAEHACDRTGERLRSVPEHACDRISRPSVAEKPAHVPPGAVPLECRSALTL